MNKLKDLREHLLAAVPGLASNPDRLLLFADDGSWSSTSATNLSFLCSYTATLVMTDFAGAPVSVMLPVLQWVARHQNELLANPTNRDKMTFEVEVLASDLVDLTIKLSLTERFVVTRDADSALQVHNPTEPPPEYQITDSLRGGQVMDSLGNLVAALPAIDA
ncbi:phage tail protein [Xanthomonas sp. 60]